MTTTAYFIKRTDAKKAAPLALSVLRVDPAETPRFAVQMLHGLGERKELYLPLMTAIAAAGGTALLHDLRGHGNTIRTPTERGYFGDLGYHDAILGADIDAVWNSAALPVEDGVLLEEIPTTVTDTPAAPRYLLGFSLGALMAALELAKGEDSLAGVILAGLPCRKCGIAAKLGGVRLLSLLFGEDFRPREQKTPPSRMQDPLCNPQNTLNAYETRLRMRRDVYRPASWDIPRRDVPILLMAGELDPITGGDRGVLDAARFFSDMGFSSVDSRMYRGMGHEIFLDGGCDAPINDVLAFCAVHLDRENARLDAKRAAYTPLFETKN